MSKIQYTIRGIPPAVDKIIRKRSARTGKSFNGTVVAILSAAVSTDLTTKTKPDIYDRLYGANTLGPEFDEAIKELSKVDKDLWK